MTTPIKSDAGEMRLSSSTTPVADPKLSAWTVKLGESALRSIRAVEENSYKAVARGVRFAVR